MPRVFGSKAFTFEHMTQMTLAVSTYDFDSASISIGKHVHIGSYHVIKGRPSAARVEFIR